MQEKAITQIIKKLDRIIFHALNINYNKNVSILSLANSKIIKNDKSKFNFSASNIEINIHAEKLLSSFTKIEYRIPQTRIFVTFLQEDNLFIRIIEYFNHTIVIVEFIQSDSEQVVELCSKKYPLSIKYTEKQKLNEKSVVLSTKGSYIAQISETTFVDLEKLPDFVNDCINDEIRSHPISRIQTNNLEFIKLLDQKWSLIKAIKQSNEIDVNTLLDSDLSDLFWIQEIYLQLGWHKELEKFYKEIHKQELSSQNMEIVTTALYRYNVVSKLIGSRIIQSDFNRKKSTKVVIGKFLSYLYNTIDQQKTDIYASIQKTWNYLHIPAVKLKFQYLIQNDPNEYLALAILALQYRFWWYEIMENILIDYLPEDKKILYKFLSLLNKFNIVQFNKASIYFSKYDNSSSNSNFKIRFSNSINKSDTSKNKESYTEIEKDGLFFIKINKCVDYEYFPNDKKAKIRPQTYFPDKKKYDECVLNIAEFSLYVPLIWDQFTIEFNKCRFKFLRKKYRFQLTIKFEKSISQIKVNDENIKNNFAPVFKYYLPINRVKSSIEMSVYNVHGAKLKSKSSNSQVAVIKGIGYNAFGIMYSQFRVYPEGQKKSYNIDLDSIKSYPFNLNQANQAFTLNASKSDPVKLHLNYGNPFVIKLLNTHTHELFYRLKIYIDKKAKIRSEIIKVCKSNLGFIPQIDTVSELKPDRNHLICIISDSYGNQSFKKGIEYTIIPINKKTKQTALWFNPKYIQNLFSEAFFTSFYA
ncbi:MAG: hypothetical protein P8Y99_02395 [Calditrichaceae bacterium]